VNNCSSVLFSSSSSKIGNYSLKRVTNDYFELTNKWYNELLLYFNSANLNDNDIQRFDDQNNSIIQQSQDIYNNSIKIKNNMNIFGGDPVDNVIQYDLIGINKECFVDSTKFNTIWKYGIFKQLFGLEEYEVTANSNNKYSKRKLERSLSILNNEIQKIAKVVDISSIKSLHLFAADSVNNFLLMNRHLENIVIFLLIITFIYLFILSISEYVFKTSQSSKCCKVFWVIILCIFLSLQVLCLITLTIAFSYNKNIFQNLEDNKCLDDKIINLLKEEIKINKFWYFLIINFIFIFLELIFGIIFCVMLNRNKHKHRFWKSIPDRLA
jgi:ABC-type sugar transport system permease subunit